VIRFDRSLALAGALALLAAAPPLVARDRFPIEVTVKTSDGKPVEAARVLVVSKAGGDFRIEGPTSRRGRFEGELPDFGRLYRLTVSKEGSATFDRDIDLAAQNLTEGMTAEVGITLLPPEAASSHNEGIRALEAGDAVLAEAKFREAITLDPTMPEPRLALAATLRRQNRIEDAIRALEEAATAIPTNIQILDTLAFEHLELKRFEPALSAADRALSIAANDAEALRNRYDALVGLDRQEDAEAALDAIAEKNPSPETARLLYNAGATASNAKQFERARHRLAQALAIDPKLYQAHAALAEIAIGEKDFEGALAELDKTLAISPRNFKAFERKIEVLRALGREADAAAAEEQLKAQRGN
jgi:tetratricopeptide (TPR) repeat protein